jgi:alcohol dehydrogenase class IV
LLRESSNAKGEGYDLNLLTGAGGDGNIPHGALLVSFADAVLGTDDQRLDEVRAAIRSRMGNAALVDAAAIVATFNAIDRVADATGIPIEDNKAESTADIRAALGINAFAQARGEIVDPRDRTDIQRL